MDHIVSRRDDANFFVDRHHQWMVYLEQIVVYIDAFCAAVGHIALFVVQSGDDGDAFAFTLDVVVTPLPLIASGFDGEVCIGCVFLRNHCFGGRQCHQDHDDERDDSPSDFNFDRFVEASGLVSH